MLFGRTNDRAAQSRPGAADGCCGRLLAIFAWSQQAERRIQRHAAPGETVRLDGHVNYRTCGYVIPTAIIVNVAPTYGTLSVRDEMVTSINPELGRSVDRCKGYSGQGKVVYYTRTSPGVDVFQYTSSSANGDVHVDATVN